jgi:hypothetical protein
MLFGTFAAARDAFYVSALLMGLSVGFALSTLKTRRRRAGVITGSMYLFSIALFFTTFVLILSRGAVLRDGELVRAALSIAAFAVVCALFPIQMAFPAFIIAGALVVWTGVEFRRYPQEPNPHKPVQVAVRSGDLLPIIGGEIRYLDREPDNGLLFREEFAVISPTKHRFVFSFVSNQEPLSSAAKTER